MSSKQVVIMYAKRKLQKRQLVKIADICSMSSGLANKYNRFRIAHAHDRMSKEHFDGPNDDYNL